MKRILLAAFGLAAASVVSCSDETAPLASRDPQVVASVAFCSGNEPDWVAFQDGDGEWQRATPAHDGFKVRFEGTFSSVRAGLATGRLAASPAISNLTVQYATPAELSLFGDTISGNCGVAARTWHGGVAGLDGTDAALVGIGSNGHEPASAQTDFKFTLRGIGAGPQAIFAERVATVDDEITVTGVILRHGVDLADGEAIPVLDFKSAEVLLPMNAAVHVGGLLGQSAVLSAGFRASGSISNVGVSQPAFVTAGATPYLAIPGSALGSGDLQFVNVTTQPNGTNSIRSVLSYFQSTPLADVTVGAMSPAPVLSVVAGSSHRIEARFDSQADYDQQAIVTYQQGGLLVNVIMTAAYAAETQAGFDLVVPDLSGTAGFDPAWLLQPGTIVWTSNRTGGTIGLGIGNDATDGSVRRTLVQFGTTTLTPAATPGR
jgi:hypothetical protein